MREPSRPSPILKYRLDHNWGLLRELPAMVLPRVRPQRLPMPLHSPPPRPQDQHLRLQQVPPRFLRSPARPRLWKRRSRPGISKPQASSTGARGSSGAREAQSRALPTGLGSRRARVRNDRGGGPRSLLPSRADFEHMCKELTKEHEWPTGVAKKTVLASPRPLYFKLSNGAPCGGASGEFCACAVRRRRRAGGLPALGARLGRGEGVLRAGCV